MGSLNSEKSAVQSKSVQGSVLALIAGVLGTLETFGKLPQGTGEASIVAVTSIISGVGGLWALFGSLTRKARITSFF